MRARCVTMRARCVTMRARCVTRRARWVTRRARWVTLRARWVTLRACWVTLGLEDWAKKVEKRKQDVSKRKVRQAHKVRTSPPFLAVFVSPRVSAASAIACRALRRHPLLLLHLSLTRPLPLSRPQDANWVLARRQQQLKLLRERQKEEEARARARELEAAAIKSKFAGAVQGKVRGRSEARVMRESDA
jgi:hypothetical protein